VEDRAAGRRVLRRALQHRRGPGEGGPLPRRSPSPSRWRASSSPRRPPSPTSRRSPRAGSPSCSSTADRAPARGPRRARRRGRRRAGDAGALRPRLPARRLHHRRPGLPHRSPARRGVADGSSPTRSPGADADCYLRYTDYRPAARAAAASLLALPEPPDASSPPTICSASARSPTLVESGRAPPAVGWPRSATCPTRRGRPRTSSSSRGPAGCWA
jgi:hypothetical protein